MKKSIVVLMLGMGLVFPVLAVSVDAQTKYANSDTAMRDAKKMLREGMYPASVTCVQDKAKKFLKPDITIDWKKNVNGIEWDMKIYKGQLQVRPGFHEQDRWHEVYKKTIASGGATFWCLIYHRR